MKIARCPVCLLCNQTSSRGSQHSCPGKAVNSWEYQRVGSRALNLSDWVSACAH